MSTTDPKREVVKRFCQDYIRRLREILRANPPKDSPCSSCAFNRKTDRWVGFMGTIYHLIQAVRDNRPFYCHRNMKRVDGNYKADPQNMIPCANYEAIKNCQGVKEALTEAALSSEPIPE